MVPTLPKDAEDGDGGVAVSRRGGAYAVVATDEEAFRGS